MFALIWHSVKLHISWAFGRIFRSVFPQKWGKLATDWIVLVRVGHDQETEQQQIVLWSCFTKPKSKNWKNQALSKYHNTNAQIFRNIYRITKHPGSNKLKFITLASKWKWKVMQRNDHNEKSQQTESKTNMTQRIAYTRY